MAIAKSYEHLWKIPPSGLSLGSTTPALLGPEAPNTINQTSRVTSPLPQFLAHTIDHLKAWWQFQPSIFLSISNLYLSSRLFSWLCWQTSSFPRIPLHQPTKPIAQPSPDYQWAGFWAHSPLMVGLWARTRGPTRPIEKIYSHARIFHRREFGGFFYLFKFVLIVLVIVLRAVDALFESMSTYEQLYHTTWPVQR